MVENKILTYSSSPHVKTKRTTRFIMANVCIALLPSCIAGCIFFGLYALLLLSLAVVSAFLSEVIYKLLEKKSLNQIIKEFDFTSIVTGLLVGMTVGVNYPWYTVIFGSVFAIIVVKMLFGGTGCNLVNPAIAGRIFIFISFQSVVTAWVLPNFASINQNALTGATALDSLLKTGNTNLSLLDLFLGTGVAGCIGETCKLALILGGIYLAVLGIINILYPIIYIVITGVFTVVLCDFNFELFLPSILSGGLILGAIFMATDYVTTPNTNLGNIIYFALLGLITAGLRVATKMEVVSFSILLMNLVVPLIDKFIVLKPFGYKKVKEGK